MDQLIHSDVYGYTYIYMPKSYIHVYSYIRDTPSKIHFLRINKNVFCGHSLPRCPSGSRPAAQLGPGRTVCMHARPRPRRLCPLSRRRAREARSLSRRDIFPPPPLSVVATPRYLPWPPPYSAYKRPPGSPLLRHGCHQARSSELPLPRPAREHGAPAFTATKPNAAAAPCPPSCGAKDDAVEATALAVVTDSRAPPR
jgi:hypothetical protein